ncbi:DCC-interacting protein 13-alpha, partial [Xenotaenia resolanae]
MPTNHTPSSGRSQAEPGGADLGCCEFVEPRNLEWEFSGRFVVFSLPIRSVIRSAGRNYARNREAAVGGDAGGQPAGNCCFSRSPANVCFPLARLAVFANIHQCSSSMLATRSLLGVFEEDTAAISNYCTQLYQAMQRIYDAQNELSAATHLTSRLLKEYDKQRFPLGGDDEVMSSTLQQFSKVIDELSSCHAVLSTQLADAMMFPVTQFKERDLKEILTLKEVFQIASDDHDAAINRYSRLSKRKDNDKVRAEVVEDVYTSRKKQHQTMMHYFCALNTLQYKKKTALLEPLLGYMQAQ